MEGYYKMMHPPVSLPLNQLALMPGLGVGGGGAWGRGYPTACYPATSRVNQEAADSGQLFTSVKIQCISNNGDTLSHEEPA